MLKEEEARDVDPSQTRGEILDKLRDVIADIEAHPDITYSIALFCAAESGKPDDDANGFVLTLGDGRTLLKMLIEQGPGLVSRLIKMTGARIVGVNTDTLPEGSADGTVH